MRILQVIHGFPPEYMAGSEVYTHNLVKELSKHHSVFVFTRVEDLYRKRYETDVRKDEGFTVCRVNNLPRYFKFRERYRDKAIEDAFERFLDEVDPDVAHFGHLNHLSTSLVMQAKRRGIPTVFTLHDFWLICQRGQFLKEDLPICEGQEDRKCARCLSGWIRGENPFKAVRERMLYLKKVMSSVDLFIAPSRFLMRKFIEFGVPENRIIYSDYGFNTGYFKGFRRLGSDRVRFGYIGTLIRSKGVNILIKAFNEIERDAAELKIFGRDLPDTIYLKAMATNKNTRFMGEYDNREIARILAGVDVVVVPSIWFENSPLVIHEAFLAKAPVIASNAGGMAELVHHGENGLLFKLGDPRDLTEKMMTLIENRDLIKEMAQRAPPVKPIQEHAEELLSIYRGLT